LARLGRLHRLGQHGRELPKLLRWSPGQEPLDQEVFWHNFLHDLVRAVCPVLRVIMHGDHAGQDSAALQVEGLCLRTCQRPHLGSAAERKHLPVPNGHRLRNRSQVRGECFIVHGNNLGVV